MITVGNRIIFDQDGDIVCQLGEMQGVSTRKVITSLGFIDLKVGEIDYKKYRIISINPQTKQPTLEEIPPLETEEQLRIEELENELLLTSGVI